MPAFYALFAIYLQFVVLCCTLLFNLPAIHTTSTDVEKQQIYWFVTKYRGFRAVRTGSIYVERAGGGV